ncbi:hypothetical protein OESDEN_15770, partial [Oesophagostomum dentatum]
LCRIRSFSRILFHFFSSWISGEPFDHSADGRERCAILRVHARVLDDVDCEAAPGTNVRMRFVCEREQDVHKKQQKSQNFIWSKLEKLLEYFGFAGNSTTPSTSSNNTDYDYVDELKKINLTSKERDEMKNIKIDKESSSEEQAAVESALKTLNKPGQKAFDIPEAETETSRPASQEDRPDSSSELLTGSVSSSTKSESSATTPEAAKAPEAATEAPEATTDAPEATTDAPEAITEAPEASTEAPEATTEAPEATTEAPEATT